MMDSPAALAVTAVAERTVAMAAGLSALDQARHVLDGRYSECLLCLSEMMPMRHVAEDGEFVEFMFVHEDDCPVAYIEKAIEGLTKASRAGE